MILILSFCMIKPWLHIFATFLFHRWFWYCNFNFCWLILSCWCWCWCCLICLSFLLTIVLGMRKNSTVTVNNDSGDVDFLGLFFEIIPFCYFWLSRDFLEWDLFLLMSFWGWGNNFDLLDMIGVIISSFAMTVLYDNL